MNGPQDIGGMTSFGPVVPEADEPVFHAEWERRALALSVAVGATGLWPIDRARHARECLPPSQYWSATYYEIWTEAMINQLIGMGMLSEEELSVGRVINAPVSVPRVLAGKDVMAALTRGWPADRPARSPARFEAGDKVAARNVHVQGHTRLPLYVRGRRGEVTRVHGVHVFPDTAAHGMGEQPQWLYNVRFSASELWGENRNGCVHLDLWEPYLESAP